MVTYLAGLLGDDRQEGLGGLIPVGYLAVATALLAIGLTVRTPDRRRRSLWVAALLLAPAALYLLPVWWLSVPLLTGALGAGASAFLVGHRQRCQRIRRAT